jgi:hypothetical protein
MTKKFKANSLSILTTFAVFVGGFGVAKLSQSGAFKRLFHKRESVSLALPQSRHEYTNASFVKNRPVRHAKRHGHKARKHARHGKTKHFAKR